MPDLSESPKPVIFHNGELHRSDAPLVAVTDQVIVQGQGVFETLVAHKGEPFAFQRHIERLERSAELVGLSVPGQEKIAGSISLVMTESGFDQTAKSRIRITLTGGIGNTRFSSEPGEARLFIEVSPAPSFAESTSLITVPFPRNDRGALAGAKTINYGENVVALRLAKEAGADEAIFGNTQDLLCEGTWSNIFVFKGGKWITPPLSSGCLPGVTRALVLEQAVEIGTTIEEIDLKMSALASIEGAFLTSTLRDLQPVREVDGWQLPLLKPPGFSELEAAFQKLAAPKD